MDADSERRLVFGDDASRYDRYRPSYPAAVVDRVVALAGRNARVLDVGCGTAKGTRLLAAAGLVGVAVEPHPAMAEIGRQHLDGYPGWRVDVADFETWRPHDADRPVHLVTSAQAWHWIDLVRGFEQVRDLLEPGGWMAVWWNLARQIDSPAQRAFDRVYEQYGPEGGFCPRIEDGDHPFQPLPEGLEFDAPRCELYEWEHVFTTAELVEHQRTHSNHMLMNEHDRERLLAALAEAIDDHGGSYTYPYVCRLWVARRR
jgi:SAM-dependent methyltransferase